MEDSVEHQLSQALLEKLEPLINTVESQLRDLAQGQAILQNNVAQLSTELDLTQIELDKVHDTFARLPHYVAKLTAMKNTIASVTALSRKLKRRADQVAIGREKQAVKMQMARAKEQAYDQAVAAVQVTTFSSPLQSSTSTASPAPISGQSQDIEGEACIQSPQSQSPSSMASIRLPFPLPAKPAFPVVSTMRSSFPKASPLASGKMSDRDIVTSSPTAVSSPSFEADGQPQERVDRFPQVSSIQDDGSTTVTNPSEVEVVRLRRKKKPASRSSTSSIASISTTTSIKPPRQSTKTKNPDQIP
ncbi:hypothetical protein BGZ46_003656 [Entomortierella lignicola]|nr:hypothetical protein BGZ46_003656 [Entomortierella lignicola]